MKPFKVAPGVFQKGRFYYLVVAAGKKRKWLKRTRIAEGLPAVYTALAKAKAVTDTDLLLGREAARRKGQHSTEKQTATYIRHRLPQKARATK